jgi:cytochrome c oxidase subunit 4
MTERTGDHPLVSPLVYAGVWAGLVLLTGVTVGISFLDMQRFTVFTALLIATAKATLVLLYFMHIRFLSPIYTVMLLVVLAIYAIFVILSFSDYSFR